MQSCAARRWLTVGDGGYRIDCTSSRPDEPLVASVPSQPNRPVPGIAQSNRPPSRKSSANCEREKGAEVAKCPDWSWRRKIDVRSGTTTPGKDGFLADRRPRSLGRPANVPPQLGLAPWGQSQAVAHVCPPLCKRALRAKGGQVRCGPPKANPA